MIETMGQSLSVALKSIRLELKRFQRRQNSQKNNKEEHQSILAASSSTSCAVAFEDPDAPIVDPPFL